MLSFYVAAILKQGRHGQFLAGKSTLLNSDACKKITLGKLPCHHCFVLSILQNQRQDLAHFLYRFLDGKKTTRSQSSVPGLREIHNNLKQEKFFNSRESFFWKSPFCTFSCINPEFGGVWVYSLRPTCESPFPPRLSSSVFFARFFWLLAPLQKVLDL